MLQNGNFQKSPGEGELGASLTRGKIAKKPRLREPIHEKQPGFRGSARYQKTVVFITSTSRLEATRHDVIMRDVKSS